MCLPGVCIFMILSQLVDLDQSLATDTKGKAARNAGAKALVSAIKFWLVYCCLASAVLVKETN